MQRGIKVEFFSRSSIQLVLHFLYKVIRNVVEIRLFRDVFADKFVAFSMAPFCQAEYESAK